MAENLIQIFSNPKLLSLIQNVSREYQFTVEEDISLKSLLLTTYLLTRNEASIYQYFNTILSGILSDRNKNQFDTILNSIIDDLFKGKEMDYKYAEELLQNMVFDGYCFHSFNASFLPTIQEKGLVLHDKPWDNEEIEKFRVLFKEKGIVDVFGLYQGRKETPIFFASSLKSSRFYAYSSPTWYRHFVSGGMKGNSESYDKNAFFTRNYEHALKNVEQLCNSASLKEEEQAAVFEFFHRYWNILATHELPCIALIKRTDVIANETRLEPSEKETAVSFAKRLIAYYEVGNHTIRTDVEKEKLIIFPYELEKIAIVQPKKGNTL